MLLLDDHWAGAYRGKWYEAIIFGVKLRKHGIVII
jgi:hypothetical protein